MNAPDSTSVTSFRHKVTFLTIAGGLLFLGSVLLPGGLDRLTLLQWLYRLDFRYWFPSIAYPLWLIFAILLFDALTFRTTRINTAESGNRSLRFATTIFSIKVFATIYIIFLFLNHSVVVRSHWLWWYPANLALLSLFLAEWQLILKTKNRYGFMPEILNVHRRFLIMSCTVICVLGVYNFLHISGLIRYFSYPLWEWFGYGIYSHMAAFAFFLICIASILTIFVVKEWLFAVRQTRKTNRITLSTDQQ